MKWKKMWEESIAKVKAEIWNMKPQGHQLSIQYASRTNMSSKDYCTPKDIVADEYLWIMNF